MPDNQPVIFINKKLLVNLDKNICFKQQLVYICTVFKTK